METIKAVGALGLGTALILVIVHLSMRINLLGRSTCHGIRAGYVCFWIATYGALRALARGETVPTDGWFLILAVAGAALISVFDRRNRDVFVWRERRRHW